jgi:hypothetical protein
MKAVRLHPPGGIGNLAVEEIAAPIAAKFRMTAVSLGSMPISSRKSARIVAGSGSSSMVNAALQPRCAVLDSPY